jgi:2-polyprenyl-6-methoxyphenol hydroxylase-like FAD-dependent oxidoreductase
MSLVTEERDVVIVGAGVGGAALATVLARGGLDVLVLERQTVYRDKVRGEFMAPWGVAETLRLGLTDVLLRAGGGYSARIVVYDEGVPRDVAEANALPLQGLVPGVPGSLNVGHPQACEALAQAAAEAGACVVRGVGDVVVTSGAAPAVGYDLDDVEHHVRCRLVVGADGRNSSVRRQAGIELHETTPRIAAAGILVEGLRTWQGIDAIGTAGDVFYLVFPRPGGLARLYLMWDIARRDRFAGANREAAFLDAFRVDCLPGGEELAAARPAGPCATYPMNDTWSDVPFTDGVVLIGDAAGWNDPIIGQGLSIAMRDARIVADVLLAGPDWSSSAFAPYAEERAERMRRLRLSAQLTTELRATFTPAAAERRRHLMPRLIENPTLVAHVMAQVTGPETAAAEAFEAESFERILASD